MPEYFYHTLIQHSNNKEYEVAVLFRHFFPEHYNEWQDKFHGNVAILQVLNAHCLTPLPLLPIIQQIKLRRGCWNYLSNHQLLNTHNIVSFNESALSKECRNRNSNFE